MTESEFKLLDPIADQVNDACGHWFESPEFAQLKAALQKASSILPKTHFVSINVELQVFDEKRETTITLLRTGINAHQGNPPHDVFGDSTVHRYTVNGEICMVPHDYCPHCWGSWDFKLQFPTCKHCGFSLGKEVRLLLDQDLCPSCEKGSVSAQQPICLECGYRIDPNQVYWG